MTKTKQLLSIYLLFTFFLNTNIFSQNPDSCRQKSYYTYIFKISNSETEKIYKKGIDTIDSSYFHSLVDSFGSEKIYTGKLPNGHYLKAYTDKNNLSFSLTEIQDFDVKILDNSTDLLLQVYDNYGKIISDAEIKIKGKNIKFDKNHKAYRQKKSNKKGILSVKYKGLETFYYLNRQYNNPTIKRISRKIIWGTPIQYIWRPLRYPIALPVSGIRSLIKLRPVGTFGRTYYFFRSFYWRVPHYFNNLIDKFDYDNRYQGYLIFNKPKYKPGDTLKYKAFIINKKGKPLNKELTAVLTNQRYYSNTLHKTINNIKPYDKGAYTSEFVLTDSLNLKLDKTYRINLNKKNSKYKTAISSNFKYEDYELKSNKLTLKTDKKIQYKGDNLKITLKGTDENNLNLQDARYEITVKPTRTKDFFKNYVFIPDTLFHKKGNLKTSGKTEIIIPDTIFPAANFDYKITAVMHTSDNERTEKSKNISYFHKREEIKYKLINDSVKIWYEVNGIRNNLNAEIKIINHLKNDSIISVQLPARLKIKQHFRLLYVKSDNLFKKISLFKENPALECYTFRNKDSLLINIENPRKLKFNYFLYKHNKEILSNYTDSLHYKTKHPGKKSYFLSLQYLWGGKTKTENYTINVQHNNSLNVKLIQPKLVYPGQKSKIKISVSDENGKPVKNTDLTAYSLTKKFGYKSPSLPVFSNKQPKSKELINSFNFKNIRNQNGKQILNYSQWKRIAGLDSMEYYNFIYPEDNIYITSFETPHKKTQFAPYVLKNGEFQKIHVVFVDGNPVYFSWMTTQNPYSFRIDSGYHRIKLRLTDTLLVIDSIYFKDKQKTIFSVNKNFKNKEVTTWKEANKFSSTEKNKLKKYIFPYRYTFGANARSLKNLKKLFSYIEQENTIIPLQPKKYHFKNLAGPVDSFEKLRFKLIGGFDLEFNHEANFQYDFMPKILKMRSIKTDDLFPYYLQNRSQISKTSDFILTKEDIEKQYSDFKNKKRITYNRYENPNVTVKGFGTMISSVNPENLKNKLILNTVLLKLNSEKFVRVYPGNNKTYFNLEKGYYKLIYLLNDSSYFEKDSVFIKANGDNYFRFTAQNIRKDSFSIYVNNLIDSTVIKVNTIYSQKYEKQRILNKYRSEHQYTGGDVSIISGYVLDDSGEPLPGVSVLIKGTTYGTMTLGDGSYSIEAPPGVNTLVFSYIGMEIQEQAINPDGINDVILMPSSENMEEVVVTALGIAKGEKSVGYSVSSTSNALIGKVAGVSIATGASANIIIRGASSIDADHKPLIIFNGVPYKGDINKIPQDFIQKIEVLKGKEAVGLYGSQAANGAIIITSKTGIQINKAGKIVNMNNGNQFTGSFFNDVSKVSALRTNFSDYAFWQPKLKTDKNGIAEFEVKFPDDITSWDTHVLAMNGKKQSGKTKGTVKSYKPLAARLSLPRFLIKGDTAFAIGKSLNYLPDSMKIKTEFALNDKTVFKRDTLCKTSVIDTLQIIAGSEDSLKVKYLLRSDNNYFDGEQRKIPVFPVGLERTSGQFYVLDKDTTIKLNFNKQLGEVTLYAKADALDILNDEIGHLIYYMHNCNEQMASKLKAMLADEEISKFKNKKYRYKSEIKKLVRKLSRNQNKEGLWGWWGKSKSEIWITNHVSEALLKAKKHGYKFKADKTLISDKLHHLLETDKFSVKNTMTALKILKMLDADINYKYYVEQIEKSYKDKEKNFNTKLKITELKQFCDLPVETDWLNKYKKTTFFGNVYFSDSNEEENNPFSRYYLINSNIQSNIIAYNILKNDSNGNNNDLLKMRNYFFEQRKTGYWRNTYESSKIVETLLPDLLQSNKKIIKQELILSEKINKTVTKFPYSVKLNANDTITISKKGTAPIYLTSYQRFWKPNPEPKENNFIVKSYFNTKDSTNNLKAGDKIKLIVELEVKKDADYVMLDIPSPAACSYASKKNYFMNEVHREYRKHKTNIYCRKLNKGNYKFELELLVRYSGKFTLNPAKAELMYFPVFEANNKIKKINVSKKNSD